MKLREIYPIVAQAVEGFWSVQPGMTGREMDAVARSYIAGAVTVASSATARTRVGVRVRRHRRVPRQPTHCDRAMASPLSQASTCPNGAAFESRTSS